jgi:hypothetical protein
MKMDRLWCVLCSGNSPMTKLKRKLALGAKRRSHKKNVLRRKEKRAEDAEKLKKETEEKRLEAEVEHETAMMDGDMEAVRRAAEKIDGLVVERPHEAKKSGKKLSRKQLRRKEKMTAKGVAISANLAKKLVEKTRRIQHRAVVRNQDLHN